MLLELKWKWQLHRLDFAQEFFTSVVSLLMPPWFLSATISLPSQVTCQQPWHWQSGNECNEWVCLQSMSWGDAEDAQELPNVLQGSEQQEGSPACWDRKDADCPMPWSPWHTERLGLLIYWALVPWNSNAAAGLGKRERSLAKKQ